MIAIIFSSLLIIYSYNLFVLNRKFVFIFIITSISSLLYTGYGFISLKANNFFFTHRIDYNIFSISCTIINLLHIFFGNENKIKNYINYIIYAAAAYALSQVLVDSKKILFSDFAYMEKMIPRMNYKKAHLLLLKKATLSHLLTYFLFFICLCRMAYKPADFQSKKINEFLLNTSIVSTLLLIISFQYLYVYSGEFEDGKLVSLEQAIVVISFCTVITMLYNIKSNKNICPEYVLIRYFWIFSIALVATYTISSNMNYLYTFFEKQDFSKIDYTSICISSIIIPIASKVAEMFLPKNPSPPPPVS